MSKEKKNTKKKIIKIIQVHFKTVTEGFCWHVRRPHSVELMMNCAIHHITISSFGFLVRTIILFSHTHWHFMGHCTSSLQYHKSNYSSTVLPFVSRSEYHEKKCNTFEREIPHIIKDQNGNESIQHLWETKQILPQYWSPVTRAPNRALNNVGSFQAETRSVGLSLHVANTKGPFAVPLSCFFLFDFCTNYKKQCMDAISTVYIKSHVIF